jgi:hypothetical protein
LDSSDFNLGRGEAEALALAITAGSESCAHSDYSAALDKKRVYVSFHAKGRKATDEGKLRLHLRHLLFSAAVNT